ncbi:MAG: hypothetical protein ACK5LV_08125 [Lachnospirales bacterium]
MKKNILTLGMALTMIIGVTSCGGNSTENETSQGAEDTSQGAEDTSQGAEDTSQGAEDITDISLPVKYPEETVKIGVEIYDATDSETLKLQDYYASLVESGLNVEFIYSEALTSAEAEMAFIDNCYNAGVDAVFGYYNISQGEVAQKCFDYGMYYTGAAFDYEDVIEKFDSNEFAVSHIKNGDGDYNAGYSLGEYCVENGASKVVFASGGADFGVTMFVNRRQGFLDAIEGKGIEVIDVAGFPGDAFFADQTAALTEDIDTVVASFNGLDFWAQPIATAGKSETVDLITIGAINDYYIDAFENGTVSYLISSNLQRHGIAIALLVNAVQDNAEQMQVDGNIGIYTVDLWSISTLEEAVEYNEMLKGSDGVRYDDLMTLMAGVCPEASSESIQSIVDGCIDLETLMERNTDCLWNDR